MGNPASCYCTVLLLLVIFSLALSYPQAKTYEVKFLSIIFRHGDRAPDINTVERYENDPYLDYDFYPNGIGALTNNGKKREFALGETIRRLYGDFLGDIYLPSDIVARSTDYERTKMSLQLVLAGIYPPTRPQQWNPALNWQPAVTIAVPSSLDVMMIPEECPLYQEEFTRVKQLPEVRSKIEALGDFMKALEEVSGKEMRVPNDMFNLYHALMAESSMGLEMPAWVWEIFPYGLLWNGTILEYQIVSYNEKLKRLNGGMLLKNITQSMIDSVQGINNKKMHLLSGHETNIAALLQAMGIYKPHVPEYSSSLFFELLSDGSEYYVRVMYYLGIPSEAVEQTIPGCSSPCPLRDFLSLLDPVIPTDQETICPKKPRAKNPSTWKPIGSVADLVKRRLNHI